MKNKKRVQYESSLVTYVDILGFKRIIKEHSAGQISRLLRIVTHMTRPWPLFAKTMKMIGQNFADLSVRITPIRQSTAIDSRALLLLEITALTYLQEALVGQGVLLRGAVTLGEIVKSWGLIYGPALVRANELEKKAVYPRIILDPELFDLLGSHDTDASCSLRSRREGLTRMLAKDHDGMTFVDYLRARDKYYLLEGPKTTLAPRPEYLEFLRSHKELIADGLGTQSDNERVYSKYKWLKRYHNEVVQSRRLSKSITKDLLV